MRYEKTLPALDTEKIDVEETRLNGKLTGQTFSGKGFCVHASYRPGRVKVSGRIADDAEAVRYDLHASATVCEEDIRNEVAAWAKKNGYDAVSTPSDLCAQHCSGDICKMFTSCKAEQSSDHG